MKTTVMISVILPFKKNSTFSRELSGLPWYDVIVSDDVRPITLPVVTLQQAKARLQDGRWDFDYLYFSESDQVR